MERIEYIINRVIVEHNALSEANRKHRSLNLIEINADNTIKVTYEFMKKYELTENSPASEVYVALLEYGELLKKAVEKANRNRKVRVGGRKVYCMNQVENGLVGVLS